MAGKVFRRGNFFLPKWQWKILPRRQILPAWKLLQYTLPNGKSKWNLFPYLFPLGKCGFSLSPTGQNADTLSMETSEQAIEAESALVVYLGIETYVETLSYLCDGLDGYRAPRKGGHRANRDPQHHGKKGQVRA